MKKFFIIFLIVFELLARNITFATEEVKINARNAIVYDRKYKKVLYEKNINERVPNASTTKMLTAIVAYENADMNETVTISKKAANTGGSRVGLRTGDKVVLGDLMHGLLICSGNDAAVAIAEHVSGSEEEFCEKMNDKAKEIGAINTNFMTPHGLDRDNHYSTAYDLALIADYAMNIEYIKNIVCKKMANIKINDYTKTLTTTNEMLSVYDGTDGIKTGYTSKAGRCLITSATRDDWQLICVVLGCDTKNLRTSDSVKLLNYAFDSYKFFDVASIVEKKHTIFVEKSKNLNYVVDFGEEYILPMTNEEIEKLNVMYELEKNFSAPFYKGEKIGNIRIFCGEKLLKTFELINNSNVLRKTPEDYIKNLLNDMSKYLKL
ncbi:MAG: D-alanyl-D-alanine carboxypeptidase [Clostridia bacterium]|nr:D-alanyl-D-alanine carboxypeptidase [Clostridia bacterium]